MQLAAYNAVTLQLALLIPLSLKYVVMPQINLTEYPQSQGDCAGRNLSLVELCPVTALVLLLTGMCAKKPAESWR